MWLKYNSKSLTRNLYELTLLLAGESIVSLDVILLVGL